MRSLYVLEMVLVVFGALLALYTSFFLSLPTRIRWSGPVDKWFFTSLVFLGAVGAWPMSVQFAVFRHLWATTGAVALVLAVRTLIEIWQESRGSTAGAAV